MLKKLKSIFIYSPKIKICGITNKKDAIKAAELGVDFIGFNFYPGSKRYMTPQKVHEIINVLYKKFGGKAPKNVGIFVNQSRHQIQDISEYCPLDILQFSGDEASAFSQLFHKQVWKTIHIEDEKSLVKLGSYLFLPVLLLDKAKKREYGGTGESFDFSIIPKAKKMHKKIMVAGGLNIKNIKEVLKHKPWGVDINSGVEKGVGVKDHKKMEELVKEI